MVRKNATTGVVIESRNEEGEWDDDNNNMDLGALLKNTNLPPNDGPHPKELDLLLELSTHFNMKKRP